ncbi:MAG TPA: hypothetical protein VMD09_15950 [Solirubrobacteraceae bacterium]|nr:hypothetical protein [Solirubrobacteraceae bacterium]
MTETQTGLGVPSRGVQLEREATATAEVPKVRHAEMQLISDRLGRCARFPLASVWWSVATLAAGALIGGALGLIPFYATSPSNHWKLIYFVAMGACALVAVIAVLAAMSTHRERSESIKDIKADFDKHILDSFQWVSGGDAESGSS